MDTDPIVAYVERLDPTRAAIGDILRRQINGALPNASARLWHGIPVWFIGENPAVGFTARKKGVMLMFWNGQHFEEPELEATGSFHMAQIAYDDANQIDSAKLARWLEKAGTSIWDMVGERNAFVAARRRKKAKAKAKAKKAKAPRPGAKKPSRARAKK
jgi:hypothetical protein